MSQGFETPQQAEDAFYDALEEHDPELMMRVWDESPDIGCLLPMQPFVFGDDVRKLLRAMLESDMRIDLRIRHLHWVETDEIALHYVQEITDTPDPSGRELAPPVYATNVYRRRDGGWQMLLHQNSPPPPPQDPSAGKRH